MRRFAPSRRILSVLAVALLSSSNTRAQTTSAAPPSPQQLLPQLVAAEGDALDSGDGPRILASGRQLAALALRLLGGLFLQSHDLDRALHTLEQSLSLDESPDARLDLALTHILNAQPDLALAECARLTSAQPNDSRAWQITGQAELLKNNPNAAVDALTRSWTIAPELETGLLLITADLRAGRPGDVAPISDSIVRSAGDTARTHMALGSAHHSAGDLPGTIAELARALVLSPDLGVVHLALGEAFWEINEYGYNPDSLREFTAAQHLDPAGYDTNFDLGSILSQYQRYNEAAPFLKLAAAADPLSPDPWLQLGLNAYAEVHLDDARSALQTAADLTGSHPERNSFQIRRAYNVLSRIAAEQGHDRESADLARKSDTLHARMLGADLVPALSQSTGLIVNNSPRTISSQTAAVTSPAALSPSQQQLEKELQSIVAKSLNDAATVLARGRDYAGALPLFRQAAAADPSLSPVMRNLGLAAFHAGAYKEAVDAFTRALDQTPGDPLLTNYLAESRTHLNGAPAPSAPPNPPQTKP